MLYTPRHVFPFALMSLSLIACEGIESNRHDSSAPDDYDPSLEMFYDPGEHPHDFDLIWGVGTNTHLSAGDDHTFDVDSFTSTRPLQLIYSPDELGVIRLRGHKKTQGHLKITSTEKTHTLRYAVVALDSAHLDEMDEYIDTSNPDRHIIRYFGELDARLPYSLTNLQYGDLSGELPGPVNLEIEQGGDEASVSFDYSPDEELREVHVKLADIPGARASFQLLEGRRTYQLERVPDEIGSSFAISLSDSPVPDDNRRYPTEQDAIDVATEHDHEQTRSSSDLFYAPHAVYEGFPHDVRAINAPAFGAEDIIYQLTSRSPNTCLTSFDLGQGTIAGYSKISWQTFRPHPNTRCVLDVIQDDDTARAPLYTFAITPAP